MPGPKTNERPGTRAVLRYARVSPYKVREVLDLVRGKPVGDAAEILRFSERDAAALVGKLLGSAVANAHNNDEQDPEELFVSACFADEGTTIKRWRPRARGRATRIRKRTCHVTLIVSRLPEDQLARLRARREAEQAVRRSRRVAGARKAAGRGRGGSQVAETAAEAAAQAEAAAEAAEAEGIVDDQAEAVAVAEEALAEEALAEEAGAGEVAVEEGEATETPVAEETVAEETVPEEAVAEEAVAEEAVAGEAESTEAPTEEADTATPEHKGKE
jgi:large subunit ribosomal protein L22